MPKRFAAYRRALPGPDQVELLQLAFAPEFDVDAFRKWADRIDFDAVGEVEMRLLPELSLRLQQSGIDHLLLPRIAGVHRRTLYANTLRLHRALSFYETLEKSGVEPLFVRSAAAILLGGAGALAQPMSQVELLLPSSTDPLLVDHAAEATAGATLTCLVRLIDHHLYRDELGFIYRLNWQMEPHAGAGMEELRRHARAIERDGKRVMVLAPEHLIFQAIWQGMDHGLRPPALWIADVLSIAGASDAIDWTLLVETADANGCREMVAATLDFIIRQGLDTPGMVAARDQLGARRDPRRNRVLMRLRARPATAPVRLATRFVLPYLSAAQRNGQKPSLSGLSDYARERWGAASRLDTFKIAGAKLLKHLARRAVARAPR